MIRPRSFIGSTIFRPGLLKIYESPGRRSLPAEFLKDLYFSDSRRWPPAGRSTARSLGRKSLSEGDRGLKIRLVHSGRLVETHYSHLRTNDCGMVRKCPKRCGAGTEGTLRRIGPVLFGSWRTLRSSRWRSITVKVRRRHEEVGGDLSIERFRLRWRVCFRGNGDRAWRLCRKNWLRTTNRSRE